MGAGECENKGVRERMLEKGIEGGSERVCGSKRECVGAREFVWERERGSRWGSESVGSERECGSER